MSRLSSRSLLLTAAVSSLALGGTLWVKPALAGSATSNISLRASVPANCTISPDPIDFGQYYASTAFDATPGGIGPTIISYNCTSGASATITLNQGNNAASGSTDAAPLRRLSNGSGSYLNYNIYQNPSRTTVWGNTAGTGQQVTGTGTLDNVEMYAVIPSGQTAATVGAYSDTVVATITY